MAAVEEISVGDTASAAARPRLAVEVSLHPPTEGDGRWVVRCGTERYFRVGPDAAALLGRLDGSRTRAELLAGLGPAWSADQLSRALATFAGFGLLADGRERRTKPRRLVFRPPFIVQFTLLDPGRLLARVRPALIRLGRPAPVVSAVLSVFGLFALAWQSDRVDAVLSHPLGLGDYAASLAVFYAAILVHELAHGAVLTYHGGRPARLGVMLFYLNPAFFCDVSDGWRLPRARQRVEIALAGIAAQCTMAGLLAVTSLFAGGAGEVLLLAAVLLYVYGIFNLLPFVKLDGYIALMSHLDVPHLRALAMADARRLIARLLFGGRYGRALPQFRWAAAYGLLCMLFPAYLIATLLTSWLEGLVTLGWPGGLLGLAAIGYCLFWALRGARRLLAEARAAGARARRVGLGSLAVAATFATLLLAVRVPYQVRAGYVYDGVDGSVRLTLTGAADHAAAQPGRTVVLKSGGLALSRVIGTATVSADAGSPGRVSIQTLVPLRSDSLKLPATEYRLDRVHADGLAPAGPAVVDVSTVPLGEWLALTYMGPEWRSILD